MRKAPLAGLLAAITLFPTLAAAAGGNITGTLGYRQVDEDQWSPTDTQGMIGVLADFSYRDFPIHFELGLRGSRDSGDFISGSDFAEARQEVGDFMIGAMLIPDYGPVRPYFSAGLATVRVEAKVDRGDGWISDDDTSAGVYLAGGVIWRLGPNFDIGVDGRYIGGTDMTVFGNNVDVDGYTIAMKLGYGWDFYSRDYGGRPGPPRRRRY